MRKTGSKCFNASEMLGIGHRITLMKCWKVAFNNVGANFSLVDANFQGIGDDPFSTYANISQRANIFYPLIRTRTCAYQGVGNKSLGKIFACVLNGWSQMGNTWANSITIMSDVFRSLSNIYGGTVCENS